jgi:hypothetical protein
MRAIVLQEVTSRMPQDRGKRTIHHSGVGLISDFPRNCDSAAPEPAEGTLAEAFGQIVRSWCGSREDLDKIDE